MAEQLVVVVVPARLLVVTLKRVDIVHASPCRMAGIEGFELPCCFAFCSRVKVTLCRSVLSRARTVERLEQQQHVPLTWQAWPRGWMPAVC